MTIREYMKKNLNTACVSVENMIVGLNLSEEPFYFHKSEGPYYFGFSYNLIQEILDKEMKDEYKSEVRINIGV